MKKITIVEPSAPLLKCAFNSRIIAQCVINQCLLVEERIVVPNTQIIYS